MKKTVLSVIALSALAMLAGCKKENKENGKAAFKASIEQQAATNRTSLEPGADNQAEIFWTTGDQINIVNAGGTPTIGTLQTGAGSTEGSFSVDENYDLTGPYKAVYPSSGTFSGNTLTLVLPETQNLAGASATFANGANPMVAVSDDENLGFKNLCGCLGLSLTGNNVHITSIKITDADGQKLNGTFTADCTANEPVLAYTGTDGSADVTLTCDTTLTAEPTQFFIVLPVGALANGFTMDIYDGGTTPIFSQSTTTATTIARNQVNVMNELPVTPAPAVPAGAIDGKFTINANGDQVYFSQGNLQYQASTNTWQFAEHQYDYVGNANSSISQTNSGWIDLFGWGTSGYDHGATCYQPWSTSSSDNDYYAYGQFYNNLYDGNGQADWGYNAISNGGNTENSGWRTLTQPEWNYFFNTRSTASGIRYAKATVNGVNGVILLPDNWTASIYTLNDANGGNYDSNTISAADWTNELEANGAVFLPAAGLRNGASVNNAGSYGYYWSASFFSKGYGCSVYLDSGGLGTGGGNKCNHGISVRLVRFAEN